MKHNKGFTLIELLVVIAIMGLLIAILLPALKAAKIQAQMVFCLSNLNGLSKAYHVYADDNDALIACGDVPRYTSGGCGSLNLATLTNRKPYWVDAPQNQNYYYTGEPSCPPSLFEKQLGIMRGKLYDYVGNVAAYRCPGDLSRTLVPNAGNPDPDNYSFRSYCISDFLYGWNPNNDPRMVTKMTDIINPGNKYVFLETTDTRGWIMGSWNFNLEGDPPQSDTLAIWHRNRSGFGFADGHAEMYTWTDEAIIKAARDPGVDWYSYPDTNSDDFKFLVRGYIPGRNLK